MEVFVTSDTFFGRRLSATTHGFSSVEEMEDKIIDNWNSKVKPNDVVYVEPNERKIKNANRNQQLLPTVLSALSIIAIIVTNLIRN